MTDNFGLKFKSSVIVICMFLGFASTLCMCSMEQLRFAVIVTSGLRSMELCNLSQFRVIFPCCECLDRILVGVYSDFKVWAMCWIKFQGRIHKCKEVSPKWWDGNGIPNTTHKYREVYLSVLIVPFFSSYFEAFLPLSFLIKNEEESW